MAYDMKYGYYVLDKGLSQSEISKIKKPNFFILGAPKCGTTSIADWLREHPQVFMSDPKEPHFFNTDSKHSAVFNLSQYERIFSSANDDQIAIGEASVWYLISDEAVENIINYQPDAKFIVCLRNPIEASVSLHDQKLFSGDENIIEFIDAWNAQEGRRNGKIKLPPTCVDVNHLMYGSSCLFGKLLHKLLEKIDREKLLVIIMDDILENPRMVYEQVLNHICLLYTSPSPRDKRQSRMPSSA